MDYDSFFMAPQQSKLFILDPVHSTGVHLTIGAFCTFPLESTFGTWRTSTFFHSLWRIHLLCTCVAKLSAQPHHPSFSTFFYLTHCSGYEWNIRATQPVDVCFHHLTELTDIHLPHYSQQTHLYPTLVCLTSNL
jgi:hypothetical protein